MAEITRQTCFWCERRSWKMTRDHVIPTHYRRRANVVAACFNCNNGRSSITSIAILVGKGQFAEKLPRKRVMQKMRRLIDKFRPVIEAKLCGNTRTFCLQELDVIETLFKWRRPMKTRLHYSEIISATDGRLVARSGMGGVYKTFDAIAGPGVTTLALVHLSDRVRAELIRQHPVFGTMPITEALDRVLGSGVDDLSNRMDASVLPLLPSEYFEVEHFDEAATEEATSTYGDFFAEKMKDKEMIVVRAPRDENN